VSGILAAAQATVDEIVTDEIMLEAVDGFASGGRFPLDSLAGRFPGIPRGELVRRQRDLERRGLLSGWTLTAAGTLALRA
jgi:hypothetical protein